MSNGDSPHMRAAVRHCLRVHEGSGKRGRSPHALFKRKNFKKSIENFVEVIIILSSSHNVKNRRLKNPTGCASGTPLRRTKNNGAVLEIACPHLEKGRATSSKSQISQRSHARQSIAQAGIPKKPDVHTDT